jgi:peptidoglycan/LPS O-acetylase OafA/YrhL
MYMNYFKTIHTALFKKSLFDKKRNNLNAIRLVLAAIVLVVHCYSLGGYGREPSGGWGRWAVIGFFCISGYLIMASREKNNFSSYITKRIARILPALAACSVVIAFVFAPIAQKVDGQGLRNYITSQPSPFDYVFSNVNLAADVTQSGIGNTLSHNPAPWAWNVPTWTLYYEVSCYLLLGILFIIPFFRKTKIIIALWAVLALFSAAFAIHPTTQHLFPAGTALNTIEFMAVFMGGGYGL